MRREQRELARRKGRMAGSILRWTGAIVNSLWEDRPRRDPVESSRGSARVWSAPRARGRIILPVIVALPLVAAHSLWIP